MRALQRLRHIWRFRDRTLLTWRWPSFEGALRNPSYAFRQIRRSPGFALAAVFTLGFGLGATTILFSVVNSVLLQPLQFPQASRLYLARSVHPPKSGLSGDFPINARQYYEWSARCTSCQSVALAKFQELTLVGSGEPVKVPSLAVSFTFFRTLGIHPEFGRDFLPEEDAPGRFGEVILSHGIWRSRFSADPSIVGRAIQLNGEPYTVVGVMPSGLYLPKGDEWGKFFGPAETPAIFRPLGVDAATQSPVGNLNYSALVRLKPGVSVSQAAAELNTLLSEAARQFHLQTRTVLISFQTQITRDIGPALWLLLAAVGVVLLVACVNVGNLMAVRALSRYREASVRIALGATRGQLFRLALTEVLLLVAAGSMIGLVLTYASARILVAEAPAWLPRAQQLQVDGRVLFFSALIAAFATLACGLTPAWRLSGVEMQDVLRSGPFATTDGARLRMREFLVALEVALSTVLLAAGGLFLISFFREMRVDKGFEVEHIITQDVSYLSPKYARGVRRLAVEETVAKMSQIPGVARAASTSRLPLRGEDQVSELRDPAQPELSINHSELASFRFITPGYCQVLGIPLRSGRFLNGSDKDQPTALVSEQAARFLWPRQNPIGRLVQGIGSNAPMLRVVGVVGDVRASGLDRDPPMTVYEHYWRMQPIAMSFVLRTRANPLAVAGALRTVLSSADPEMALPPAVTMDQIVDESVQARRLQSGFLASFALSALFLASLGIYGVLSFSVARRTAEVGIRIALGAQPPQLVAMVLRQGMRPAIIGLASGMICALFVNRWTAAQLFGVAPTDPFVLAAVAIVLLAVAGAACWIPARRAAHVDPLTALRFE